MSFENQNLFAAGQLSYIEQYSKNWNVPVLAGEFNFWSVESAWRSWLYTLSARDVSWCNWTYKNIEQNAKMNWGLYHQPEFELVDYKNDTYDEIARKWSGYKTENYVQNEFLKSIFEDAAKLGWDKIDGTTIDSKNFKVTAYKTESGYDVSNLFDGSLLTEWVNGEAQSGANQKIEIDATEPITINRLDVYYPHVSDYGRKIKISALINNQWIEIATENGYQGNVIIRFETTSARYWHIEQIETSK